MVEIDSATTPTPSTTRGWPAVAALAAGTFSVVTTEMLPVGLLTPIRADLQVSDGIAGLTMTVPGLVAAAAAPLLTVGAGRLDRRRVLVGLMTLLAAANLVSAVAPGIGTLVAARVLVGICIGGVWAIAAGLAVRLVPQRSVGLASSLVFSGIAVASVLGVPAGTLVGEWGGWRVAFVVMALVAMLVAGALAVLLPPLPAERAVPFKTTLRLMRDVRVRVGLLVVLLLVTGHFAAYTYVRPALERLSGLDAGIIGPLLLLYGVAGVVGNFLAGAVAARNPRRVLLTISAVLSMAVPAVAVAGETAVWAVSLLVVWGIAYGGVSIGTQSWLMAVTPQAREAASALFVAVFNVAIAVGAFSGGRVVDGFSLATVMWFGGLLAVAALVAVTVGTSRVPAPRAERA